MRGIRVCQEISNEFELHAFNNRTNVRSVIRRDYLADLVRSNRLRTPGSARSWRRRAARLPCIEAQGALFFGTTEQLLRRLAQLAVGCALRRSSTSSACTSPTPRPAS